MKRPARLASAKKWLPTYSGKNIVRGYRNWFGVDFPTALRELEVLGVKIDPTYRASLLTTVANQNEARALKKQQRKQRPGTENMIYGLEYDDHYAYIAGFTAGGAPFGISWEEMADFPADDLGTRSMDWDDEFDYAPDEVEEECGNFPIDLNEGSDIPF
jgi:hypothetical protein